MLHIWDDHEVANNYSQNLPYATPQQRVAGYRAAFEWLPRIVFPPDRFRLYKRIPYGALADIFLLDTRQYRTGRQRRPAAPHPRPRRRCSGSSTASRARRRRGRSSATRS